MTGDARFKNISIGTLALVVSVGIVIPVLCCLGLCAFGAFGGATDRYTPPDPGPSIQYEVTPSE